FGNIPDYQNRTSYNYFTPRIGFNWLFSDRFTAYAVFDKFFIPEYAKNYDHKPLKPMTGYNLEAGIKHNFFNKKLNTSLSVYKILTNNALTPDPLHPDNYIQTTQFTNKGVELDITGNISPAIMVNANYAFTDASVSKGDANQIGKKKIGTPDHSTNLWFKYRLLKGKLRGFAFSLGYQYMGRRCASFVDDPGGNIYLPVYNLFDGAISYRNERFNINLNVYNLTNRKYASLGYFNVGNNEWRYTPGEPTNFRLSVGINLVGQKKTRSVD
ncbi:MAG TPA: TonB-dependent receptor, partial [Chitinophagaceae bacterium]